jgi:Fe-S cluster assembly protein SufD
VRAQVAERHETLAAGFEAFRREPAFGTGAIARAREEAFARFLTRGFPTIRDEEWRFTSVAPITATPFERAGADAPAAAVIAPYLFDAVPARVVLVNGRLVEALSSAALPAGVTVQVRMGAAPAPAGAHAFVDLNAAFFEQSVLLEVAPKAVVPAPIHLLHVVSADGGPAMASPRVQLVVGEQAEVSVVESYVTIGDAPATFTNVVVQAAVGAGAIVRHVKLQDESLRAFHLASTFIEVARAGTFTSQAITLGGRIARHDIMAVLAGEGAECTLNGIYVADGDTLVDTHTTIDHAMPHCPSHEVYKGILGGRAKAVFNGKIIVRPDAQKTDAKQTNKALLLTDDAQINTKPQLEIFADDVRCTHGAAIGQLDEDAMFYLRARGIATLDARNMLIHAFAGEVLDGIAIEAVREHAMHRIEEKLSL